MIPRLAVTLAFFALTACDRPDAPEAAASKAELADARSSCVQLFQRERACTAEYLPALVDLRRELDVPAGIAAAPRDELLATAHDEWRVDSTDDAIAATCEHLAPELPRPMVAEARRCAALPGCGEVVACAMPLVREQLTR